MKEGILVAWRPAVAALFLFPDRQNENSRSVNYGCRLK
jgi:hypothetical protein